MFVLFNSENCFIGYGENVPEVDGLIIKKIKVPDEYRDISKYTWVGDFYSGKFVSIKDLAIVESQNEKIYNITQQYPTQIQLINIIKQLNILSKDKNLYDIDFKEMANNILKIWK